VCVWGVCVWGGGVLLAVFVLPRWQLGRSWRVPGVGVPASAGCGRSGSAGVLAMRGKRSGGGFRAVLPGSCQTILKALDLTAFFRACL